MMGGDRKIFESVGGKRACLAACCPPPGEL